MNERVEEIRPISRIRPVRKVALARPRRGRRELIYQLNRYNKTKKNKKINFIKKKKEDKRLSSNNVPAANESVIDVKKRVAFDRAMILGE